MRAAIFGATSRIAQEVARILAARGVALFLVARNQEELNVVAADLRARGAPQVTTALADLNDLDQHAKLLAQAGAVDLLLVAHGVLGDPEVTFRDLAAAELVLRTNLVSPISLLTLAAQSAAQGSCLAAISSVAADRGRKKTGIYGVSKAGLDAFLSALRQRLLARGVRVLTIKPGLVDTPMTAQLAKGPLFTSAAQVARGIVRAVDSGRDVVYLPGFWRLIMFVIRALPEPIFKKLDF